jgi:hypothetical protein
MVEILNDAEAKEVSSELRMWSDLMKREGRDPDSFWRMTQDGGRMSRRLLMDDVKYLSEQAVLLENAGGNVEMASSVISLPSGSTIGIGGVLMEMRGEIKHG